MSRSWLALTAALALSLLWLLVAPPATASQDDWNCNLRADWGAVWGERADRIRRGDD